MKEYKVKIIDYIDWNIISWRPTWNKIKNQFLSHYKMWIKINLDFTWIENATHSFIDELIGGFIFHETQRALSIFKFSNCNNSIKNIIKFVIADRSQRENDKCVA